MKDQLYCQMTYIGYGETLRFLSQHY